MCQLYGFISRAGRVPAELAEFWKRGRSNPHAWGVAAWPDLEHGPLVARDPRPAHASRIAAALAAACPRAKALVAHVRYGTTSGEGSLATVTNAHPFVARARGRDWAFAHNGWLRWSGRPFWGRHVPHGTTDSEDFFAALAAALDDRAAPEALAVAETVRHCMLMGGGKLNFLLSDGAHLYFFASGGGLHYKIEEDAVIAATEPLGDPKGWRKCRPGALYVAARGRVVAAPVVTEPVPAVRGGARIDWAGFRSWLEERKGGAVRAASPVWGAKQKPVTDPTPEGAGLGLAGPRETRALGSGQQVGRISFLS